MISTSIQSFMFSFFYSFTSPQKRISFTLTFISRLSFFLFFVPAILSTRLNRSLKIRIAFISSTSYNILHRFYLFRIFMQDINSLSLYFFRLHNHSFHMVFLSRGYFTPFRIQLLLFINFIAFRLNFDKVVSETVISQKHRIYSIDCHFLILYIKVFIVYFSFRAIKFFCALRI